MHNGQYNREWMGRWILNDLQQVLPQGTWTLARYVQSVRACPPFLGLVRVAVQRPDG